MKRDDAIATIKALPECRKACLTLIDEAIRDAELRLLSSSPGKPEEVIAARNQLDGAQRVRNVVARLLGDIKT